MLHTKMPPQPQNLKLLLPVFFRIPETIQGIRQLLLQLLDFQKESQPEFAYRQKQLLRSSCRSEIPLHCSLPSSNFFNIYDSEFFHCVIRQNPMT